MRKTKKRAKAKDSTFNIRCSIFDSYSVLIDNTCFPRRARNLKEKRGRRTKGRRAKKRKLNIEYFRQKIGQIKRDIVRIQNEIRQQGLSGRKRRHKFKQLNNKKREHQRYVKKLKILKGEEYDIKENEDTRREIEKIQKELKRGGLTRRKRRNRMKQLNQKKKEHREYLEKLNRLIRNIFDIGDNEGKSGMNDERDESGDKSWEESGNDESEDESGDESGDNSWEESEDKIRDESGDGSGGEEECNVKEQRRKRKSWLNIIPLIFFETQHIYVGIIA